MPVVLSHIHSQRKYVHTENNDKWHIMFDFPIDESKAKCLIKYI